MKNPPEISAATELRLAAGLIGERGWRGATRHGKDVRSLCLLEALAVVRGQAPEVWPATTDIPHELVEECAREVRVLWSRPWIGLKDQTSSVATVVSYNDYICCGGREAVRLLKRVADRIEERERREESAQTA